MSGISRLPKKTCEIIGCNEIGDWHHILPTHLGGTDRKVNLAPLCRMHHDLVHKIYDIAYKELPEYELWGNANIKYDITCGRYGAMRDHFLDNAKAYNALLKKHIKSGYKEEDFNLEFYKEEIERLKKHRDILKSEFALAKKRLNHHQIYDSCLMILNVKCFVNV